MRVCETVRIRFNADFFNVLNHLNNPNTIGGDGLLNARASGLPARALQRGLQLRW